MSAISSILNPFHKPNPMHADQDTATATSAENKVESNLTKAMSAVDRQIAVSEALHNRAESEVRKQQMQQSSEAKEWAPANRGGQKPESMEDQRMADLLAKELEKSLLTDETVAAAGSEAKNPTAAPDKAQESGETATTGEAKPAAAEAAKAVPEKAPAASAANESAKQGDAKPAAAEAAKTAPAKAPASGEAAVAGAAAPTPRETPAIAQITPLVLENRRKQETFSAIQAQLNDGIQILQNLVRQGDTIKGYLAKTETELDRFEKVGAIHQELLLKTNELVRVNRELKERSSDLTTKVDLLENQKKHDRETLEQARAAIARLSEEVKTLEWELGTKKVEYTQACHDRDAAQEKSDVLAKEISDKVAGQNELKQEIAAIRKEYAEKDKQAAELEVKLSAALKDNADIGAELRDLEARFESTNAKLLEARSDLEQKSYELSAETSAREKALESKDKRIHSLESKIEVLTKQLALGEEMIASLNHDIDKLRSTDDDDVAEEPTAIKPAKKPAPKRAKSSSKADK